MPCLLRPATKARRDDRPEAHGRPATALGVRSEIGSKIIVRQLKLFALLYVYYYGVSRSRKTSGLTRTVPERFWNPE